MERSQQRKVVGARRGGLLGELWAYLAGLLLPAGGLLLALILGPGSWADDLPAVAGWQARRVTEAGPPSAPALASPAPPTQKNAAPSAQSNAAVQSAPVAPDQAAPAALAPQSVGIASNQSVTSRAPGAPPAGGVSGVEVAGVQTTAQTSVQARPLLGDAGQPGTPLMMLGAGLVTIVLGVVIRQRGQPAAHTRYLRATY